MKKEQAIIYGRRKERMMKIKIIIEIEDDNAYFDACRVEMINAVIEKTVHETIKTTQVQKEKGGDAD